MVENNLNLEENTYIEVNGVSKRYSDQGREVDALSDINFTVKKGEIVCIVGASGCGKSTLLRAIAGIDTEYDGEILVGGKKVSHTSKETGIVFQEHRLFPWLTVEQNIGYALDNVSKEKKKQLISKYIELVGLTGFEKAYPRQLSGGMAQRGGIARALVNTPPLLLLDEPFGALDTFTKISMQNELKRIQKSSHTTMIMVTHDIDEAIYLSNHLIVLSSRPGKIKKIFNIELAEPRNRNSNEFLEIRKKVYAEFFEERQILEDYSI